MSFLARRVNRVTPRSTTLTVAPRGRYTGRNEQSEPSGSPFELPPRLGQHRNLPKVRMGGNGGKPRFHSVGHFRESWSHYPPPLCSIDYYCRIEFKLYDDQTYYGALIILSVPPHLPTLGAAPGLTERVASHLRADIVAGRYAPAAQIPTESKLAAGYGVSRTVVREAV